MKLSDINKNCNKPADIEDYLITAETANMLQFINVLKIVLEKIIQLIDVNNVFKVLKFVERYDFIDLIIRARCFALTEFSAVKRTRDFFNLNIVDIYKYLSDIHLWCENEMDVFHSLIDWVKHHQNDEKICNESSIFLLLTCLNFNSLSIDDIIEIREHVIIQQYSEIVIILNFLINNEHVCYDKVKQLKNSKCRKRDYFFGILNHDPNSFNVTWYV